MSSPIEDVQQKCNKMIDMLTKRDEERRLDLKKEKDIREIFSAENEKLDYIEKTVMKKLKEIEDLLDSSHKIPQNELASHFDAICKNILTMQKYVSASNMFLTTYTIKKYQEIIQELTTRTRDLEDKLMPKKRFGFKNKTKKIVEVEKQTEDEKNNGHCKDEVDFIKKPVFIYNNDSFCGFKNRVGEVVELKAGTMLKKDVSLSNLEKCTIKLFGAPSTLHMSHLKNCYIFCGPVSTSIFAEDCDNCTFVIACQQLRLHSSTNINIYLHVTSRAIMEDCSKIYFAPYNLRYNEILNDFNVSGLDIGINHWNDADDFNWLNKKQSPNWGLLEDAKIIRNWDHMINATWL